MDENAQSFLEDFTVARAMTRVEPDPEQGEGVNKVQLVTIPDSLLSVSCCDLGAKTKFDYWLLVDFTD